MSKLTPELEKVIYKKLAKGATWETVAQSVGICRKTLYNWMEEGEKNNPEFTQFTQRIKEIRADCELELVDIIWDSARKDPKMAVWLLSHMNRETYGEKQEQRIEHSGKIDSNIVYEYKVIKDGTASPAPIAPKTTGSNGSDETV